MSSPREEANLAAVALARQAIKVRDGQPMNSRELLEGYADRFEAATGQPDDLDALGALIGALASLAAAGVMAAACAAGKKHPGQVTADELDAAFDGLEREFLEPLR